VTPAAPPVITLPTLPASLTCEEAAAYVAPSASYTNGVQGTCNIMGMVAGVKTDDFTICGGTITITYTIDPADNCDRPAIIERATIQVLPAPAPTITIPQLPASLTCEEAANYRAPDASYNNGASARECVIAGTTPGTVADDFTECGGSITITWTVSTGCDNRSVQESATIPVTPATPPVVTLPQLPASLTCEEAAAYVAPSATYSNGQTGTCAISGTVDGIKSDNFTICGGEITITYTIQPADNCDRPSVIETATIPVQPAPVPQISIPQLPASLSCDEVASYIAPDATYTNNTSAQSCLISGTTQGVIDPAYTVCGGAIIITWTVSTGCDNQSVQESATIPVEGPDAPVITCPQPLVLDCDDPQIDQKIADWLGSATAQGDCGAQVQIENNFDVVPFTGGCSSTTGTKQVTFRAVDECGMSSLCTATVEIIDNNDPVWNVPPVNISLECSDPQINQKIQEWINNQGGGSATDACSEVGYTSDFDGSFDRSCNGETTVTFTANDGCDNTADITAVIRITDTTDPVFTSTLPVSMTVDCENVPTAPTLRAEDCNGADVTFSESESLVQCGKVITRTWTATDGCGNSISHTQTITVDCQIQATVAPTSSVNCSNPNGGSATVTVTRGQPAYTIHMRGIMVRPELRRPAFLMVLTR